MRTSAIVCAALVTTVSFSSLAQAQGWRHEGYDTRREAWPEHHQDRQQWRAERRAARQEAWREQHQQQHWAQQQQRNWVYNQPRYIVQQPTYIYAQPRYEDNRGYVTGAHHYRGGYLPYEYRQARYYVNDWQAHPGLYAPPYGHQWVNTGSDFVLIALTTGLIATLLSR